jgi:hypothetical protein
MAKLNVEYEILAYEGAYHHNGKPDQDRWSTASDKMDGCMMEHTQEATWALCPRKDPPFLVAIAEPRLEWDEMA